MAIPGEIISDIPIPGMTCTWHPEHEGGFWSCELKHDEIALLAFEDREHWWANNSGPDDPGSEYFWLKAEQKLLQKYRQWKG